MNDFFFKIYIFLIFKLYIKYLLRFFLIILCNKFVCNCIFIINFIHKFFIILIILYFSVKLEKKIKLYKFLSKTLCVLCVNY